MTKELISKLEWIAGATSATPGLTEQQIGCLLADIGRVATQCAALARTHQPEQAAQVVPEDVLNVIRAIHRRPSDSGLWLDDLTRILRSQLAASQHGEGAK